LKEEQRNGSRVVSLCAAPAFDISVYKCQYNTVHSVKYSNLAREQLRRLRAHDARRIVDAVNTLESQPNPASHPRVKTIRGIKPPWGGVAPFFQLRVGDFRVFFDLADDDLLVNSVRGKGRRTTEEAL